MDGTIPSSQESDDYLTIPSSARRSSSSGSSSKNVYHIQCLPLPSLRPITINSRRIHRVLTLLNFVSGTVTKVKVLRIMFIVNVSSMKMYSKDVLTLTLFPDGR